jgi:hypothetical protein
MFQDEVPSTGIATCQQLPCALEIEMQPKFRRMAGHAWRHDPAGNG